jgi:hypothetical protein
VCSASLEAALPLFTLQNDHTPFTAGAKPHRIAIFHGTPTRVHTRFPPYVRAARAGGESSRPQFLSKLPIGHPAQLMRMPRLERLLHPAQLVVQHIERALLACVRLEH